MRALLAVALALLVAGDAVAFSAKRSTPAPRECAGATGAVTPTYRATGAILSGTAAISPAMPTGVQPGDLMLMFCENSGEAAQTASGWTQVVAIGNTGTYLTVLYRINTSGLNDATTTSDAGDHQTCRIMSITAGTFCPSSPIHGTPVTSTQAATTAVSITGMTTTVNNTLVVQAQAASLPDSNNTAQFGNVTNANLTSLTERIDNSQNQGNGGAIYAVTGVLATAGATGTLTCTGATSAVRAGATFAIQGR